MKNFFLTKVQFVIFTSFMITTFSIAQNWHTQTSNTNVELEGIQMTSASEGWICGDDGILLHTTNSGNTWALITLTGADFNQIVFKNNGTGIVVGDDGIIFTTSDGGTNWVAKNSNTSSELRGVAYSGGSTFFAIGDDGAAVKSIDNGNTWTSLITGTIERLLCVSSVDQNVWIGGRNGLLLFSNDGGNSFNIMNNPSTDDIKDIQFVDASTGFACGDNPYIMFTSNGGTNWTSRSSGIQDDLDGLYFANHSKGWVVGDTGFLYSTTNAGINWISEQSQTIQDLNSIHSFDGENVWAVGDFGTIITNFNSPTDVDKENSFADSFTLEQNYPNPFNPSTNIRFSIAKDGFVKLKIFNVLGMEIQELINQELSSGTYNIRFDASQLNSGIYFYSIITNDYKSTRKMNFIK